MISRTAGEIQRGLEQFHPPVPSCPPFFCFGWLEWFYFQPRFGCVVCCRTVPEHTEPGVFM